MSILSQTADSSAVLGVYTKQTLIHHVVPTRQLVIAPLHHFLNDLVFSFRIKMWWCFVSLLHGVMREEEQGTWVHGDSVVELCISGQAVQTDDGTFHITIQQFSLISSTHRHLLLSAVCRS